MFIGPFQGIFSGWQNTFSLLLTNQYSKIRYSHIYIISVNHCKWQNKWGRLLCVKQILKKTIPPKIKEDQGKEEEQNCQYLYNFIYSSKPSNMLKKQLVIFLPRLLATPWRQAVTILQPDDFWSDSAKGSWLEGGGGTSAAVLVILPPDSKLACFFVFNTFFHSSRVPAAILYLFWKREKM